MQVRADEIVSDHVGGKLDDLLELVHHATLPGELAHRKSGTAPDRGGKGY
jgi:hypothetical protein